MFEFEVPMMMPIKKLYCVITQKINTIF